MKFSSFTIKNYRGIAEEVCINLNTGNIDFPYVLVGNNESGKTTILSAIELIGKLCISDNIKNSIQTIDMRSIIPKTGGYFTGDIVLTAELLCDEQEKEAITLNDDKKDKKLQDDIKKNDNKLTIAFKITFDQNTYQDCSVSIMVGGIDIANCGNICKIIQKYIPEVIFYDDFMLRVPDKIRFLKKMRRPLIGKQWMMSN